MYLQLERVEPTKKKVEMWGMEPGAFSHAKVLILKRSHTFLSLVGYECVCGRGCGAHVTLFTRQAVLPMLHVGFLSQMAANESS